MASAREALIKLQACVREWIEHGFIVPDDELDVLLAAPPSAQEDELHRTTEGLLEAANIRIRQLIAALEEAQATKGNQ